MLARNKHSSLLRTSMNYESKKFYNIVPWGQCYKTFFVRDLQIFRTKLVFVRLDWKSLPRTNTLAYNKNP
jgi:hypothetical protein